MNTPTFTSQDILAKVIHSNYRVLVVLDRLGIKLGFDNKTIKQVAEDNHINTEAFLMILNLFCRDTFMPRVDRQFEMIPDLLKYLKRSHTYFLKSKIPEIQENIHVLVETIHDSRVDLVETFYTKYIEEVTDHINYENETVFPYIEEMYDTFINKRNPELLLKEYEIGIYSDHHDDIEDVLKDLKNILIRHLPQNERGKTRRIVLQQLFELESDLFSHTRIEDEVLIPLVKQLESSLHPVVNQT